MPSKYSTANAPAPVDARVTITETGKEVVAAKEFPGRQ
jgi:hypothetical protein